MKLFGMFLIAGSLTSIFPGEGYHSVKAGMAYGMISEDTVIKPTVALEEVILQPMTILFISDTADDMAGVGTVFANNYPELFRFININGIIAEKVMAFYPSYNKPILVEVAVQVNKLPDTLSGKIRSKTIAGGDAIVAHYKGPYEQMGIAYQEVTRWIKENSKKVNSLPFEVYLNDPATVKNKYELKTDVYQLISNIEN